MYGIVPTYQPSHFGRVYAAYGGWFIILSIIWGWLVDHVEPDRFDVIGAMVCLAGVAVMMYWPRQKDGKEEEAGQAVPCPRATRGRRLPSLDTRI